VRLGAVGKIMSGSEAASVLGADMDFVVIGRAAILHHDFPNRVAANPAFRSIATPVTPNYLLGEEVIKGSSHVPTPLPPCTHASFGPYPR
jgi:2,4-dienoyl-CoA reductase-like NADH-dependent reductase (Old Yellow Enzyme family)